MNRRAGLEAQATALRSGVGTHNQKCGNVPANTPLAAECAHQMAALRAEIAAYAQAVKNFNQAVDQAPRALPPGTPLALLSERDEFKLGQRMSKESEGRMTFVADPQVTTYVQGLVDRLARVSTRSGIAYSVKVCNACAIPACFFACSLPGGHIYVSSALIRNLGNEAELAAVLSHEIGHVAARHQVQNLDDYGRSTGISVLAGPVWPVVQSAVFMKFQRDHEREADRLAVEMLYQSRIKPTAMITLFGKIRRMRRAPGALDAVHDAYFASHPSEEERIRNLELLLADPRFNQLRDLDAPQFRAVKNRLASP